MKENVRDGLIEASVHLVNKDYDALAGDFVTLGYAVISLGLELFAALICVLHDKRCFFYHHMIIQNFLKHRHQN